MSSKPRVSFIIPTLNAAQLLPDCLESVALQSYRQFEVLIIDGGSSDDTVTVAKKVALQAGFTLRVFKNPDVDAESGKRIGIRKAKGSYIVLLDADNRIVGRDWLQTGITILDTHPEVWGVESEWLVNPADPLLNQYFALLKVADPVARVFSPADTQLNKRQYDSYSLLKADKKLTPVIGANGFFYRKSLISSELPDTSKFEEVNYVAYLMSQGHTTYGRIENGGIHHLYCTSLAKYIKKRRKIALKFIARKSHSQTTWVDKVGPAKFIFSVGYNASILGPSLEASHRFLQSGNWAWFYHPVVSFLTVAIYGFYYVKAKLGMKHA